MQVRSRKWIRETALNKSVKTSAMEIVVKATTAASRESDIKAVLLVGGKGTRLRSVLPSTPKPLAPLGNRFFLDLLVDQLRSQGIQRIIMCVGYLREQIEQEFGTGVCRDVSIEYAREDSPLGTGGAIRLAGQHIGNASEFLVLNGDSFLEVDLWKLIHFHRAHKAIATLALRRVENAARYGTVELNEAGQVTRFAEKAGIDRPGLVNAGVYVFNRSLLGGLPEGPASLEIDVLPRLVGRGFYGQEQDGMFIDIGRPEDYQLAQRLSERLSQAALHQGREGNA
jgi:NDP-sugar pyrophosphorylase family protein